MIFKYNLGFFLWIIVLNYFAFVQGRGLLLLYRPRDLTNECVSSEKIRYDISYGMGMSDTISVVFRTLTDIDYECEVDITTDLIHKIIVVIRFPNNVGYNCAHNPEAFHVMKKMDCYAICDELDDQDIYSRNWILYARGRFRFQFRSNSSLNSDMNAHLYMVTVTTARSRGANQSCLTKVNETECYAPEPYNQHYCMTSGIECDGIMNCGAEDWYDERKSECELPIQHLGYGSILAVLALSFCVLLAGCHILLRFLPSATSYFIFNTNEDNRLYIDPLFIIPGVNTFDDEELTRKRLSVIPVDWNDTSLEDSEDEEEPKITESTNLPDEKPALLSVYEVKTESETKSRKSMKLMSKRIHQRLRSVAGGLRSPSSLLLSIALDQGPDEKREPSEK